MDEAKRFIRYVIPGIVFIIEVIFYLIISARYAIIHIISSSELADSNKSIAIVLAALLTSGGLGYIFSNIYYFLVHTFTYFDVDHRRLLRDAEEHKWIKLSDKECEKLKVNKAWIIVVALWKGSPESSEEIKSADNRMDSLADILHGLGTSAVASLLALIVWIYLHLKLTTTMPYYTGEGIVALCISVFMIIAFIINYSKQKRKYRILCTLFFLKNFERSLKSVKTVK